MSTKETTPSYEMFSEQGNRKYHTLVKNITEEIHNSKHHLTKEIVEDWIKKGMNKIEVKHPEVYDTEPRMHIVGRVEKVCRTKYGNDFKLDYYL